MVWTTLLLLCSVSTAINLSKFGVIWFGFVVVPIPREVLGVGCRLLWSNFRSVKNSDIPTVIAPRPRPSSPSGYEDIDCYL